MKRKYSIVRVIAGIIVIILCINALFGNVESSTRILPYMLMSVGVLQIPNGIDLYKQGKKSDGIIIILSGAVVFFVAIKIITM